MSFYLCIDCGGTKTHAAICDVSGDIVGRALGGPSNFAYVGVAAFTLAIKTAVEAALTSILNPSEPISLPVGEGQPSYFAAAWLGVSGCDSAGDVAALTTIVSSLFSIPAGPNLAICNDTHLLAAPLSLHPDISHAVACIGGTGSIVVSFTQPEGSVLPEQLGRVGGWGWILGDNGGGYDVGRESLRVLLLESDKASVGYPAPISTMHDRVLAHFGTNNPLDLLRFVHDADPLPGITPLSDAVEDQKHLLLRRESRISNLAPIVFKCAFDDGDALALVVLNRTSRALADQISVLLVPPSPSSSPPARSIKADSSVLCFGGSLVGVEKYRALVLAHLKEMGHVFRYVEFVDDPAGVGARALATAARV